MMYKNMEHSHSMKQCKKEFPKIKVAKKIEEVVAWY